MKKLLKILLAIIAVVIFVVLIGIIYLFHRLPSPQQLGSLLNTDQKRTSSLKLKKSNSNPQNNSEIEPLIRPDDSVQDFPSEERQVVSSEKQDLEEYLDFIDPTKPRAEFCSFLNQANGKKLDFTQLKNTEADQEKESSKIENDLRFKAVEPVFKSVVMQPKFKDLVTTVLQNAKVMKDQESLENMESVQKALFYKKIYDAYWELRQNLPVYEELMDRSYLVYKINDLIVARPDLKNDPRVIHYCEKIQSDFNLNEEVQFEHEKAAFERLMAELGVTDAQINYNKNYKTKFGVNFTKNSLIMDGGWLDEIVEKPRSP